MRRTARVGMLLVLWPAALAGAALLALARYDGVAGSRMGVDFSYFLHAARNVAHWHSPYLGLKQYVYPPALAIVLAPFSHAHPLAVWHVWLALIVAVPLAGAGAFVAMHARRVRAPLLPVLFAFCAFTLLWVHYWPMGRDLYLGQTDTMVLPFIVLAGLAADRYGSVARGVAVGAAALVKAWPAVIGVAFLQRRLPHRWRSIVALVATALLAPVLTLALWNTRVLHAFLRNAFAARQQKELINDSVWAIPRLLFANSGLAHPLTVSGSWRVAVTAVLACWVVGLLLLALWTPGEPALCTWNVTFCILLLLPVAHRQYAVLVLPLLWWWAARQVQPGRRRRLVDAAVLLVLAGWWLVQSKAWPYTYSPPTITAVRYSAPFAADLLACTASVLGARFVPAPRRRPTHRRRRGARPESADDGADRLDDLAPADSAVPAGVS